MKLLLLSFVLTFSAFGKVCLEGRSTTEDGTGSVKGQEICYVTVKKGSGGSLAKGAVTILDEDAENGFTINTSSTAGAVPHCVLMEACASNKVCKCQTYGYASFVDFDVTNSNATKGNLAFISENNAGYIQGESEGSYAASDVPVGVFLETASASGEIKVWLKLD